VEYGEVIPPLTVTDGAGTGAWVWESGNPNVATIDESGNITIIDIGETVITATKEGESNYEAGSANITLKVVPAHQTITFHPTTPLKLADGAYPLTATASSGLPVYFLIETPITAAGLAADGFTLLLHHIGDVRVTAYTQPDPTGRYLDADPVERVIRIVGSNTEISDVTVGGAKPTCPPSTEPCLSFIIDPSQPEIILQITTDDPNTSIIYDGKEYPSGAEIPIKVDNTGIHEVEVIIKAEDGTEHTEIIHIDRMLWYEQYALYEWNRVVFLNMRKLTDEGYLFAACRWYEQKPGEAETLLGQSTDAVSGYSWSKGASRSDMFITGASYRFELVLPDGSVISSTSQVFTPVFSSTFRVYPNPAQQGEAFVVEVNMPTEWLQDAIIKIYTNTGHFIRETPATGANTRMELNQPGIYIIRIKEKEAKIVIY
jgi:hypothetical protein